MGRHLATQLREYEVQFERLKAQRAAEAAAASQDQSLYAWYDTKCPCGLEPGDCKIHPRARWNQRPPEGDWSTYFLCCGRGFGKSKSATEWLRHQIESGRSKRAAIVAATAADARDVLVEGESGMLAICPPWNKPVYEPSKRRLTWKSGAIATLYTAEEPNRLRGPSHDCAIIDELAAWERPETFDNLKLGLRLGQNPQLFIATTPRPTKLLKSLVSDPDVITVRGSTYENELHLAPTFFNTVVAKYNGTRLGQQEIYADILDTTEGAWFANFDRKKNVSESAEYYPRLQVHLAIDCGVSRHVGAVWLQVENLDPFRRKVTVFGEYLREGAYSAENALAIKARGAELPCMGRADTIRLDPASVARTGVGPAAYGEFERVLGGRNFGKAPGGSVVDILDLMECLLDQGMLVIHPRCVHLIEAFQNYRRIERGGEFGGEPAPNQSPHEDMMDALRYGIKSQFPEGRIAPKRDFRQKRFMDIF